MRSIGPLGSLAPMQCIFCTYVFQQWCIIIVIITLFNSFCKLSKVNLRNIPHNRTIYFFKRLIHINELDCITALVQQNKQGGSFCWQLNLLKKMFWKCLIICDSSPSMNSTTTTYKRNDVMSCYLIKSLTFSSIQNYSYKVQADTCSCSSLYIQWSHFPPCTHLDLNPITQQNFDPVVP